MRQTELLTVALVVAAVAAIPLVGMAATGDGVVAAQNGTNSTNATSDNATVAPGERLSGIVGVQGAELEGEVDKRAFGLQVAKAATDNARAEVVNSQFEDIQKRLNELEQRKENLTQAHRNGSMSDGAYRARTAEMAAKGGVLKQLANQTNETASKLPADVLRANGVNVTAIRTLQNNAANLTGPQVAAIAQSIAGPSAVPGRPNKVPGQAGPGDKGPSDRPDAGPPTPGAPVEGPTNGTAVNGTAANGTAVNGTATNGTATGGGSADAGGGSTVTATPTSTDQGPPGEQTQG